MKEVSAIACLWVCSNVTKSSKLKPDAPEFIPSMPKANDRAPSKTDAKNAAKEQKKLEKLEKEQQKQQRKAGSSVGKKPGKGLGRHDGADGKPLELLTRGCPNMT